MKRTLAGLGLLANVLVPALAHAKAIEDVTVAADASDVVISIVADEALNAPSIRTYPGAVRVRFYDVKEPTQLKIKGDGDALRGVDVGQGSDRSAAVTLALGDKTRLETTDVRIEMKGETIVLRIARGLLPAVRADKVKAVEKEKPAPEKAEKAEKPALAKKEPAGPPAPKASAPAAEPAPAAKEDEPAEDVAKPEPAPTPTFPLSKKPEPDAAQKPDVKLTPNDPKSSPMPILLGVTALLALAYGGMRLFMKKKGILDTIPAIDVVAQRRLGPRHQLVVVRAFDRDYLLSIQGGQTTVVARSSRKKVVPQRSERPVAAAPSPTAPDLLPPMASLSRSPAAAPPARDTEEDDEVTFGGELFRHALEQRERARENTTGMRLEAARAEARAEIARMEASRRESEPVRGIAEPVTRSPSEPARGNSFSETLRGLAEPMRGLSEQPARGLSERSMAADILRGGDSDNDNDGDEYGEGEASLPPSADGISESVTGLLRLRRKSGR